MHANPGSLQVRAGNVMALYEAAVARQDLETAASMVDTLQTYFSVHMTPKQIQVYMSMPGFAYGDGRTHHEIFRDVNLRLAYLLGSVKGHVFAKLEVPMGDSTGMDQEELAVA